MNEAQVQYLEKARRSLIVARQNKEAGFPEFALSRAYYTMFYVASAFLEGKGLAFGKHSAVIAAFGQHFAKTGQVPKPFIPGTAYLVSITITSSSLSALIRTKS